MKFTTPADIIEKLVKSGLNQTEIAMGAEMEQATVSRIRKGTITDMAMTAYARLITFAIKEGIKGIAPK